MASSIKKSIYQSGSELYVKMLDSALFFLGKQQKERIHVDLSNRLTVLKEVSTRSNRSIRFLCPSQDALFRANTFFEKEPETLAWIDSFAEGETLWDIGANIGVYSMYAALERGTNVLCFEPSFGNYWLLNKNIEINGVNDRVTAFCLALTDAPFLGTFNMADTNLAGACYHFGSAVDSFHYPGLGTRQVVFQQGMIGLSIDYLVREFSIRFPNHIKIDVDGIETLIVKGAKATLQDPRLKSILVEIDEKAGSEQETIVSAMKEAGLTHYDVIAPQSGDQNIKNYIFRRNQA